MLTITSRDAPSPSQVEELRSTVTPRLVETRPQGTTCLSKSTGAGPDSPWASHSITRRWRTSLQEGAHTPSGARALWEHTITLRHLRRRSYSPSYTITPRDSSPVAGRKVDAVCLHIDVAQ